METNTQDTMNRNRPYTGQMHTHLGDRGKALVSGLTVRDLADCFIRGFLLATPDEALSKQSKLNPQQLREQLELGENACINHNQVYAVDASYLDPIAVLQNMLCEVEKMMGTFPNIPLPNEPEAQPSMDTRMEADINQLGLNAPRVPKEHIDMLMEHVQYKTHIVEGTTTTVAVAVLPMGTVDFTLAIESTACVDKSNFNAALGAKYAIEKAAVSARNKLWELEGYVLALCIHNNDVAMQQSIQESFDTANFSIPHTPEQQRVIQELSELRNNLAKLTEMLSLPQPAFIDDAEWERLHRQQEAMSNLVLVLSERVQHFMVSIPLTESYNPNNTVNS